MIVTVRLTPQARVDRVDAVRLGEGGLWHLDARVRAVPEKGQANVSLEALVARELGVPKTAVSLDKGGRSRLKRLRIDADEGEVAGPLAPRAVPA